MLALDQVQCAEFTARLGELFAIDTDGGTFPLVLTEARLAPFVPVDGRRPPFSLMFRGPHGLRLREASYRLRHAELGEMCIFIAQRRLDESGSYFEAVFG